MRELMKLLDLKSANQLQWMLLDAGVRSEITTELSNAYTGAVLAVVWVGDDASHHTLRDVCTKFQHWAAESAENRPTQVDPAGELDSRCEGCGYDLRGQMADGLCPECARPYAFARERACPTCKEMVPVEFDLCWKCGADLAVPHG